MRGKKVNKEVKKGRTWRGRVNMALSNSWCNWLAKCQKNDDQTWQDLQFRVLQEKEAYGARRAFLELLLNEAIEGHCFKTVGIEFQHAGAMLFMERLSEWTT